MSFPFSLDQIYDVFYEAVRHTKQAHYTPEQCAAWAPDVMDNEKWQGKLDKDAWFIANDGKTLIGIATLTPTFECDLLFVHPDYQGMGVASHLMGQLKTHAKSNNASHIDAHVSLIAQPFFEKQGFTCVQEQSVIIGEYTLKNALMRCIL